MSKPSSGHFKGTGGSQARQARQYKPFTNGGTYGSIKSNLDLREHPTKYKQLSSKKLKSLREKEANRTLTKAEYKHKEWQKRLTARRNEAIKEFWEKESFLIQNHLPTTRNWSAPQRKDILAGKRPRFKGKVISSHHMYSVAKYPHLANRKEFIFPATFYEHVYGWHGGNTKNSLPGKPIKRIMEF